MSTRSGWCMEGQHNDACRFGACGCWCHAEDRETGSTVGVLERESNDCSWDNGRTNQNDPGPAALTAGSPRGLAELDWSSTDD